MSRNMLALATLALLVTTAEGARAQQSREPRETTREQSRERAQDRPRAETPAQRDSLEMRVRRRMAEMMRTHLGLTDDQMRQLHASNRRFEGRRRALYDQERGIRSELRTELRSADTTRQAEIGTLLDRMIAVQRQRVDLMEAEQKELSNFMTPLQRARYFGMEEQIRRRMGEMRDDDRRPETRDSSRSGRRVPTDRRPTG